MSVCLSSRRAFFLMAGALFSKVGLAGGTQVGDQTLSAGAIVNRVARSYAECTTYQDSGVVTLLLSLGGAAGRPRTSPFSTAFVRPSKFRFAFTADNGKRYIAVADGEDTRTWWDVQPGIKEGCSLELALARAAGISGGSAHTVPALLMPDRIHGTRLTDFLELERLDDAKLDDGIDCFRVQGVTPYDRNPELQERARQQVLKITGKDPGTSTSSPHVLWIDKSTFLLRRIDHQTAHPDSRAESTTTYQPLLNMAVTDGQLSFDPPVS